MRPGWQYVIHNVHTCTIGTNLQVVGYRVCVRVRMRMRGRVYVSLIGEFHVSFVVESNG